MIPSTKDTQAPGRRIHWMTKMQHRENQKGSNAFHLHSGHRMPLTNMLYSSATALKAWLQGPRATQYWGMPSTKQVPSCMHDAQWSAHCPGKIQATLYVRVTLFLAHCPGKIQATPRVQVTLFLAHCPGKIQATPRVQVTLFLAHCPGKIKHTPACHPQLRCRILPRICCR